MLTPHPSTTQMVAEMIRQDEFRRLTPRYKRRRSPVNLPTRVAVLLAEYWNGALRPIRAATQLRQPLAAAVTGRDG